MLFMQVYAQNDRPSKYVSVVNRDGGDLRVLPAHVGGVLSPDARWYAFTDGEAPGNCLRNPSSNISLLKLTNAEIVPIASRSEQDHWFQVRAWSTDSRQLLYSTRGADADCNTWYREVDDERSYVFDLETQRISPVPSWHDLKMTWLQSVPVWSSIPRLGITYDAEVFPGFDGELLIHGKVVDSGQIVYLCRLDSPMLGP
jgi:hypothetical protein